MKSKYVAIFGCFVVSFVIAALFVPPDPNRWYFWGSTIFCVSVVFHCLGVCCGRRSAEPTTVQYVAAKRGRFQFSLGTLLTIVTVAVVILAGESWRRQLQRRTVMNNEVMHDLNLIDSSRTAGLLVSRFGGRGDDDGISPIVAANHYWAIPAKSIPEDFSENMTAELVDTLRRRGMEVKVFNLGGESQTGGSCGGKRIDYTNAELCGTIVLRLVVSDGSTDFLLLDKNQCFR